jgi:hypothetical protein
VLYTACRCWTYETSLLVNQKVDEDLPVTTFYEYFAPDYSIAVVPSKEVERDNQNKKEVRGFSRCAGAAGGEGLCCCNEGRGMWCKEVHLHVERDTRTRWR